MVFGSRYLCYKYVLKMLTNYLSLEIMQDVEAQGTLIKILGEMPFELFSASEAIIFTDREGLEAASMLIDKIGVEATQSMVLGYVNDILQVKALMKAIPKF